MCYCKMYRFYIIFILFKIEGIGSAMKKKLTMILLAAAIAVSAGACGKENQKDSHTQTDGGSADNKTEQSEGADPSSYDTDQYVTLGDYKKLSVTLPNDYKVTQEQIDDYALSMAQYNAQPAYKETNKKKVESGDTVNIDYEGKKDGVAFNGGTAQGYNLTIGSHAFIDGFEDGLIGKKVGQTVDLNLTFPENYQSEELAGADVVFTVKINKIMEEDPDAKFELNDEFVKQNYNYESVEEYKKKVKEYLETTNSSSKETDTRKEVIDCLQEICEVTIPDEMLNTRVEEAIEQFKNRNCSDGTTLADFLEKNYNGMTEEAFQTDITKEVQTNLTTELILEAIAKKEGIKLEEEAFQDYVQQQMDVNAYKSAEEFYKSGGSDAAAGEAYERKIFVCNQALDMVVENADIQYGVVPDESEEK